MADTMGTQDKNVCDKPVSRAKAESGASFSISDSYDIFLSHSVKNACLLWALKTELRGMGYSVYVDWVNDNGGQISEKTIELICRQMQSSKSLLFVSESNAGVSRWAAWQLSYFKGLKGKVAVLPLVERQFSCVDYYGQGHLGLYPYVTKTSDNQGRSKLWVHDNTTLNMDFNAWLNS